MMKFSTIEKRTQRRGRWWVKNDPKPAVDGQEHPGNFVDAVLGKLSSRYMNTVAGYDARYYVHNHLRHLNAWYGFIVRAYYRYVAYQCMIKPTQLPPGSRVLDLGCGLGVLAEQFDQLGYPVVGLDVNQAAIEQSVCPQHCALVETTACLNYPDQYFDLIVSREVLEHIPASEIDGCLHEWDRVGKGSMVHIIAVTERGESALTDPTHVNVKPERWWRDTFERHGYKVSQAPAQAFFSPFGSSGYFVAAKNSTTEV